MTNFFKTILKRPFLILGFLLALVVNNTQLAAQTNPRLVAIKANLDALEVQNPGLGEKTELSVSGIALDEFLRAIAKSHKLNLSIAAGLTEPVTNNFSNVTVSEVLFFLAENYNLDYQFSTNIISIKHYIPPKDTSSYLPKRLKISKDTIAGGITVDFKNDSIHLVTRQLTTLTGENIVYAPELSNKLITLYIQNASLYKTLEQMAFANQLGIEYAEDSVYRLMPLAAKTAGSTESNRKPGRQQRGALEFQQNKDSSYTLSADNQNIGDIVKVIFGSLDAHLFYYVEPQGKLSVNSTNADLDVLLQQIFNGTKYTFRKAGKTYYIGERSQEGMRETKRLHLQYRSIEKIKDFIPANLLQDLQVVEFAELNSLIVSGSYPQIQELERYFKEIDKPVPVIQIEVMIIDFNRNHNISLGMEMGVGDAPKKSGGTISPGIDYTLGAKSINNIISGFNGFGSLNLGPVTPNFYISLKALETNGVIKTHSTPRLATLNGHEANISIGRTEYYAVEQQSFQGVQNPIPVVTRNYQSVTADFTLKIKPFVSGEGQVTLEIEVQQSDFTGRIAPDAPPGQVSRTFTTMIRVMNEDMILIGGLEEKTVEETGSGLPWVSRVPVLKWFFSSKTKRKADNRLNIFIKPTIIQ